MNNNTKSRTIEFRDIISVIVDDVFHKDDIALKRKIVFMLTDAYHRGYIDGVEDCQNEIRKGNNT